MDESLTSGPYSGPVTQLLTLEGYSLFDDWDDYLVLGLRAEHVPELIRLATDEALLLEGSDALFHAWRALGQLRAEAAVEPLTGLFHLVDDVGDDAVAEDLPRVMGMIGPAALPALATYLQDSSHGLWARTAAKESIYAISQVYPEARDACVAALTNQLEHFAENGEDLNATIIAALVGLKAVESAPVMERAFAADAVDFSMAGDWEDIQIDLGLLEKRLTPRPRLFWQTGGTKPAHVLPPGGKSREKTKKKRKEQKKSRKKNRRK